MVQKYRKPALRGANDGELAKVLAELVESDRVSAEEVNSLINIMRDATTEQEKVASEVDDLLEFEQQDPFLLVYKSRFGLYPEQHTGIVWTDVVSSLKADPKSAQSLNDLEVAGHKMMLSHHDHDAFVFVSGYPADCDHFDGRFRVVIRVKKIVL